MGDNRIDSVGQAIGDFISKQGFLIHNKNEATYINAREGGNNSAIDLTISSNPKNITNCSWETMEPHGSDHTPIISKWYYNSKHKEIIQTSQETQKYNLKKVNWELFTELAESKRWDNQFHDDIEQYQQNIMETIYEICNEAIPKKKSGNMSNYKNKGNTRPWWDDELNKIKKQRSEFYLNFRKEKDKNKKQIAKNEYNKIRNKFTNLLKKKKNQYKKERINEISADNNDTQLWNLVKSFKGQEITMKSIPPILDEDNNLIYDEQKKQTL